MAVETAIDTSQSANAHSVTGEPIIGQNPVARAAIRPADVRVMSGPGPTQCVAAIGCRFMATGEPILAGDCVRCRAFSRGCGPAAKLP